jgi:hypothetical protein
VPKSNKYRCIFKTLSSSYKSFLINSNIAFWPHWAYSALYKINNTVMPVILAGTIEFVHTEQVSTLDKFYCNRFSIYRPSQKDVPDFNNLLFEFNIMQVNRISIDGNEKLTKFFQAHYKCSICAPPITRHTSTR